MLNYIEEKQNEDKDYFKGKKVIELGAGLLLFSFFIFFILFTPLNMY